MDTNVTDIVLETTNIIPTETIDVEAGIRTTEPVIQESEQLVSVQKKEYSIVGDGVYITNGSYEDAPQWIQDAIQTTINLELSTATNSIYNNMNSILSVFEGAYVPLDTYNAFVVTQDTAYDSLHGLYESLNSNYQTDKLVSDARILSIEQTYTTEEQARAFAAQEIASSLTGTEAGTIGSAIANVSDTVTTLTNTVANNYTILNSELTNLNDDIIGSATAIQHLNAYVGIDETGASVGTGLSAYLEDSNGNIGGVDSLLVQDIKTNAAVVESKFAYNSTVNLNGVYYNSGFGITTTVQNSGSGTDIDPYNSEFWINAEKLKFTNTNQTGTNAPFTIDASGAVPQVTFNGIVSFTNVTDVPQLGSTPQEVVDAVNAGQTTTINGGNITTGSITAAQITTAGLSAGVITSGVIYNTGGNSSNYTMKIDLDNGAIYIK